MSEDRTVVMSASSAEEAQVVAALLRAADIPVYVGGVQLQDEFAVSQRMLGLQGVAIEVPADQRERAERLIEEARAAGEGDPDADD